MANAANITIVRRGGLSGLAFYIGLGFLFYALFGGTGGIFHWDNAYLYGWVLAWPLMLVVTFFVWALLAIVVIGGVFLICWFVVTSAWVRGWRHRRMVARIKLASEKRWR